MTVLFSADYGILAVSGLPRVLGLLTQTVWESVALGDFSSEKMVSVSKECPL